MFHSLLNKNLGLDIDQKSYRQAFLILSTLYIAAFVLSFYITYNLFYTKLYYIAGLEIISLLLVGLSWYFLIKKGNISLSGTLLLFTIFTLTLLFIYDQNHKDYAFAQALIFPTLAIYLKGLNKGTLITTIYILVVLSIAFMGIDTFESVPFTAVSFTNLFFTYLIIILLIYYFELSRVEAFEVINRANKELRDHKENLETKVQEALLEKQQQEELLIQQSKMAMMGEMVASVSHQWKQPLATSTSIIAAAKLRKELSKEVSLDKLFNELMTQIDYMNHTITDFSKFLTPDREKAFFSLDSSIQDVEKLLRHQLHSKNIKFIHQTPNDKILIEGYFNEFSQALLNIVSNAKESILSRIEAGKLSSIEGKITINSTYNNNRLTLTICDNGAGIPDAIAEETLFKPYNTYGTGIGLYMAKIIVDAHGGKITAYNTDEGACFELQLSAVKKHT